MKCKSYFTHTHTHKKIQNKQKCKNIGDLADSRELLGHQLVHFAVEHNVDVTLQANPGVIEFVCKGDSS